MNWEFCHLSSIKCHVTIIFTSLFFKTRCFPGVTSRRTARSSDLRNLRTQTSCLNPSLVETSSSPLTSSLWIISQLPPAFLKPFFSNIKSAQVGRHPRIRVTAEIIRDEGREIRIHIQHGIALLPLRPIGKAAACTLVWVSGRNKAEVVGSERICGIIRTNTEEDLDQVAGVEGA